MMADTGTTKFFARLTCACGERCEVEACIVYGNYNGEADLTAESLPFGWVDALRRGTQCPKCVLAELEAYTPRAVKEATHDR